MELQEVPEFLQDVGLVKANHMNPSNGGTFWDGKAIFGARDFLLKGLVPIVLDEKDTDFFDFLLADMNEGTGGQAGLL